jgi:hypothetical protein
MEENRGLNITPNIGPVIPGSPGFGLPDDSDNNIDREIKQVKKVKYLP